MTNDFIPVPREAIVKYACHLSGCAVRRSLSNGCSCGLAEFVRSLAFTAHPSTVTSREQGLIEQAIKIVQDRIDLNYRMAEKFPDDNYITRAADEQIILTAIEALAQSAALNK